MLVPCSARPLRQSVSRTDTARLMPKLTQSDPSPWVGTGAPTWAAAIKQAQDFVSQLTLAEKVNLTTGVGWEGDRCVGNAGGIPRLGFRSLCLQDRFVTNTASP